MNEINVKLTAGQVAIILDLLKPYAELSVGLSNQYKAQTIAAAMPVKAKKLSDINPEDNNGIN
jgi:hypothetical protein